MAIIHGQHLVRRGLHIARHQDRLNAIGTRIDSGERVPTAFRLRVDQTVAVQVLVRSDLSGDDGVLIVEQIHRPDVEARFRRLLRCVAVVIAEELTADRSHGRRRNDRDRVAGFELETSVRGRSGRGLVGQDRRHRQARITGAAQDHIVAIRTADEVIVRPPFDVVGGGICVIQNPEADDGVVPKAAEQRIAARVADEQVVAVAAVQEVVAIQARAIRIQVVEQRQQGAVEQTADERVVA